MADNLTQIHISATPPEGNFDDQQLYNVGVETPTVVVPTPSLPDVGTGVPTQAQVEVILSGFGEENIPDPRLFKFNPDVVKVSELFKKQLLKGLQDIYSASDYYTKLVDKGAEETVITGDNFDRVVTFNRTFDDGPYFAERYYAYGTDHYDYTSGPTTYDKVDILNSLGKLDQVISSDVAAIVAEKVLQDSFGKSDVAWFAVSTDYRDVVANSEVFAKDTTKPFSESQSTSDVVVKDPTKGAEETAATSEQYIFNVLAEYHDQVTMTDDWLGAANVDDDEYALVEKVLVDSVANSDDFSRTVDYNRTYTETVAPTEYFAQLVEKTRLDSIANADLNWFDVSTDYRDALALVERFAVLVEKPLSDQFSYSDLATLQPTKGAEETVATSERYAFGIQAVYEELLDATDDVLGQANADDDEYADFTKVAWDDVATSEVFSSVFTKPLLETVANSDSIAQAVETPKYDTVVNTDQIGKAVGVAILDNQYSVDYYFLEGYVAAFYATDVASFEVAPGTVDATSTSDYFDRVVDYKREPLDTTTTSDVRSADVTRVVAEYFLINSEIVSFAVQQVLSDTYATSENITKTLEKPFDDAVANSDTASFDIAAVYSDQVTMTDDALGVANIDDDEYATVEKVTVDTLATSDTFITQIGFWRYPEDLVAAAEVVAIDYAKAIAEQTTTSELYNFVVAPEYRDQATLAEAVSKDYTMPFTELVAQADVIALNPGKGLVETSTTSELYNFLIAPAVAETLISSEVVVVDFGTPVSDSTTTTDRIVSQLDKSVLELTATTETIAAAVEKPLLDITLNSDEVGLSTTKPFSETTSTSEYVEFAITFYRTYLELVGTSEQLVYAVVKGVADSAVTSEQVANDFTGVQLDVALTSDELTGNTLRVLADQTYFLDDNFVQPDYFGAALVAKDVASLEIKPVVQDLLSIPADVYNLEIQPGIADQATTSEQLVFDRTYNLSDTVYSSDDVLGAANIDDDEYAQVGKSLLELVSSSDYVTTQTTFLRSFDEVGSSSDQIVFGYGKSITEVSTTSESVGLGVSTVLSDTSAISETYSNSPNKGVADSATMSEYRWANNQSYLNSTYTAAGYVGTNYTI